MTKVLVIIFSFIFLYVPPAFAAKTDAPARLPGSELNGSYSCEIKQLFKDKIEKYRLVLQGQEYLYEGKFFDDDKIIIKAEGMMGTGVVDSLKLNFYHERGNYSGYMTYVVSKSKKRLNGYWISTQGESAKFGTNNCKRINN